MIARLVVVLPLILIAGCSQNPYQPQVLDPVASLQQLQQTSLSDARVLAAFTEAGRELPSEHWQLADLVLAARALNPAMAIARAELARQQAALGTASQRPNPALSIETEHHSETDGGITPWSVGALFDFVLERPAKRAARVAVARAAIRQAELTIDQIALDSRLQVAETLQLLLSVRQLHAQLQQRSDILQSILQQLQRRVELGEASNFEVSTARIDRQGLRLEQGRLQVQAAELEQQLAGVIGISLSELQRVLPDADTDSKPVPDSLPHRHQLQTRMLNQHPQLRVALARYQQAEAKLQLVIEEQIPDFVLSPGLLFDQEDRVWQLAGQWVLPVFHRNEGPVHEAEAYRQLVAAEVLQIQQQLLSRLQQLDTRARSLLKTRALALELHQELQQRQHLLARQQQLGFSGSLEILRGQLELQQASEALLQIEADYQLAELRLRHLGNPALSLLTE